MTASILFLYYVFMILFKYRFLLGQASCSSKAAESTNSASCASGASIPLLEQASTSFEVTDSQFAVNTEHPQTAVAQHAFTNQGNENAKISLLSNGNVHK